MFNRPTLQQLIERAQSDIDSRLPGTDPRLRYSVLGALARALAGAVHGVYGMLAWLARQLIPDTAEAEILARWADIWGITRTAAIAATGNVDFTGTNGTLIPAGTELQRADGALFTTDADATIALGVATAAVTASLAGAAGNTDAGSTLTLTTPIAGLNSTATVAAGGLANGTDLESDDALRTRLLERLREPPHGGSSADYIAWAKEVAGVTRAWCFPLEGGDGTVVVRFVRDNDASIIPDAAEVAAVQAHLDEERPATAAVTVSAPAALPINFTIAVVPNTAAVQQAVTAELTDLIQREGYPGSTLLLSHIREAISISAGETNYLLTVPSADVAVASGQIGTLGVITWA
jgi:uncharacterized phage protein gp47/JayE